MWDPRWGYLWRSKAEETCYGTTETKLRRGEQVLVAGTNDQLGEELVR